MPTLGELLERDGVCTRQQIEDAVRNQVILGGRLGTNLLELGYLDEPTLAKYLSRLHNVPCMHGEPIQPDPAALELLPRAEVERLNVIPFVKESKRLQVLCLAPGDLRGLDEAAFISGLKIDPIVVPEVRFWQLLRQLYGIERHLRFVALDTVDFMSRVLEDRAPGAAPPPAPAEELISEEQFARLYHRRDGFPDTQPPPPAGTDSPLPLLTDADLELVEEEPATAPGGIDRRVWLAVDGQHDRRAEDARLLERVAAPPSMPPGPAGPDEEDETLDLAQARLRLAGATDRQGIAAAVLGLARGRFRRAMLFTVHRGTAIGWEARGLSLAPEAFRSLVLPLELPSVFQLVAESGSHYLGGLARTPTNVQFLRLTGREVPLSATVLPILVRGRVVNLFYGDAGHRAHCPSDIGDLLILAQQVSRAYEAIFQRIRRPD
jgi:hypothetical protein